MKDEKYHEPFTISTINNCLGDDGQSADLRNKNLVDQDVITLLNHTGLTALNLNNNQIGDKGAHALSKNESLLSLRLRSNQIGDEGAKAFSTNSVLTSLDLWDNNVGYQGAVALVTNSTLTSLNLSFNKIEGEAIEVLATSSVLTSLNVWGNKISNCGASALAKNSVLTSLTFHPEGIGDWQYEILLAKIKNNKENQTQRRLNLLRCFLILAHDRNQAVTPASSFSKFPLDIFCLIAGCLVAADTGRTTTQNSELVNFIFHSYPALIQQVKIGGKIQITEKMNVNKQLSTFSCIFSKIAPSNIQQQQTSEDPSYGKLQM